MTDIDRQADLVVHFAGEHMTVKVPLAGPVTGEWLQRLPEGGVRRGGRYREMVLHDGALV